MNEENLKNESTDVPENTEAAEPVEADESVTSEDAAEISDTPAEGGIYADDAETEQEAEEKPESKRSNKTVIGIAAGITVIAAVVVLIVTGVIGGGRHNKYNKMYIDIYGQTAGEFADEMGMEYDELLEYYSLPADMPKDTNLNAVQNLMPLGRYIELFANGYTFEDLKEQMNWDDSITENTALGEALDKTTLRYYVGEAQFDAYKEYYGLGDEVTLDTTWGSIRNTVDKRNKELYEEQKASQEAAEKAASEEGEADDADAETADTAADDTDE